MSKKNKVGRPPVKNKVPEKMLSIRLEDWEYITQIAKDEDRSKRSVVASMCKRHRDD